MSSAPPSRLRVVVAWRGPEWQAAVARALARALRDDGHEVIWAGPHQTQEQLVETAIQEDADLIGLSVDAVAHPSMLPGLLALLADRDAADIAVEAFDPDTPAAEVVARVAAL